MPTTTGEISGVVAIVSTMISLVGITGINPVLINGVVTGVFSLIALIAAIHTYYTRPSA